MEITRELPEPFRTLVAASEVPSSDRQQYVAPLREFLTAMSIEDPNRHAALSLVCETMEFNFSQSKSLADADANVQANRELLALLQSQKSADVDALSQAFHNLSVALSGRHQLPENRHQAADLDEAITNGRIAVSVASGCGNPELPLYQSQLGKLLTTRSESSKASACEDVEEAVSVLHNATTAASEANDGLGSLYDRYGSALQAKYELLGDPGDLDKAIEAHKEAAQQAVDENAKGGCLSNLANARLRRFDHNGSVDYEEVDQALKESERAVNLTSKTYYDYPGRLVNLSNVLQVRFERGGNDRDSYLYRAVQASRDAVGAAKVIHTGRLEHAECLANLGTTLTRLFELTKSTPHIDDALKAYREAVSILPETGRNPGKYLYALGCCLRSKATRHDLDSAVEALQEASHKTPSDHKDQLTYNTGLANIYGDKYTLDKKLGDLNEMVRLSELVVDQSKERDIKQFRAAYLTNLATALARRHRANKAHCDSTSDLDRAIKTQEEALSTEFAAEDHPMRATCLHNLGMFLADRFVASKLKNREDRIRAIEVHIEGLSILSAPPAQRIKSARRAMHLIQFGNCALSAEVMREAVELLPLVSPATLSWDDQQRELGEFAGLASRAAVMAMEAQWPDFEALRLLELGRGVIISLQLGLRTDLQSVPKELALRFQKLRGELNTAPSSLLESIPRWEGIESQAQNRDNRHVIWEELQEVMRQIRGLDGLASFNDALTEDEMTKLSDHEHIVVFNVDSIRCDAFLVTRGGVRAIRLTDLKLADVKKNARLVRDLTEGQGRPIVVAGANKQQCQPSATNNSTLDSILKWLWDAAVQRILAELGILKPLSPLGEAPSQRAQEPPRIWWVTSGWLSMLPIHAAGDYNSGSTTNALDMVISSYAPTLKSRWHAVEKARKLQAEPLSQALLISMRDTPNLHHLPGAEKEIANLDEALPQSIIRLNPPTPTKSNTMSALEQCQLCHFACHGMSDPSNPSRSRLALSDPKAPLSVSEVAALNLDDARLAYLSACSAADNRAEDLLDENIHLAAGFLLAGFPSVVGTLWRIKDLRSVQVASDFYRGITGGGKGMDVGRSAVALNTAVRILKRNLGGGAGTAAVWAPYIHLGF